MNEIYSEHIKEELIKLLIVDKLSYEEVGRRHSITGSAIRKRVKKLNIEIPSRRKINDSELFTNNKSIINGIDDNTLTNLVKSSSSWKELGIKLGYKFKLSTKTKKLITNRCLNLGIIINYSKIPLLGKSKFYTKKELYLSLGGKANVQAFIRKDARLVYKNSGKEHKCFICNYNKHVDIAHIKPVKEFEDNSLISEINNIDNLIALCPNCHWEYDHKIINLI